MNNIESIKSNILYSDYLSKCEQKLNKSGMFKIENNLFLKLFPTVYEIFSAGVNQNIQFKNKKLMCERPLDHLYYVTFFGRYSNYKETDGVFPFIINRNDGFTFISYITIPDLHILFDSTKIKLTYIHESDINIKNTGLLNINFEKDEMYESYGANTNVTEISYNELVKELF